MERIHFLVAKKLAGEASTDEIKELEMVLRLHPDLHYTIDVLDDMWKRKPESHQETPETAFEKHIRRMGDHDIDFNFRENAENLPEIIYYNPSHPWRWITGGLVTLLMIFGIYWITHPAKIRAAELSVPENKSAEIVTRYGTTTNLHLPDGTSVWLNGGSRLSYDSSYGNILREVTLTGEAYFDVIKNKEKPFLIHTGNINIRVLGTAFNVKSYPGEKTIETSLIRGRIEVTFRDRPLEKLVMNPNQKLVLNNDPSAVLPEKKSSPVHPDKPEFKILHLGHYGSDSLIAETAWIQNKLIFQDESFLELAKKMERFYGVRIRFDDEQLDTLHFTGSFEKENIQQAMKALQLLSNFNFSIKDGEVHILHSL